MQVAAGWRVVKRISDAAWRLVPSGLTQTCCGMTQRETADDPWEIHGTAQFWAFGGNICVNLLIIYCLLQIGDASSQASPNAVAPRFPSLLLS